MIALLAGAGLLLVLLGAADAFSRARVPTIKSLLLWIAALGGLSLAVLLALTGRLPAALGALAMFGPLAWNWWRGGRTPTPRPARSAMTRDEAWAVLGLPPGASEAAIRDAHRRLMRMAHPDSGGSDWLAARINQARDLLLRP
jgi:hypothetical protein